MRGLLIQLKSRASCVCLGRTRRRFVRRDGFVLIEALAAFTILTIALAALMIGVFGAIRSDDRALFILRATRTARSQFEVLGVASPPLAGVREGRTDDGLIYVLNVRFINAPQTANPQASKLSAFWAHIDVMRSGAVTGKALTLGFDMLKIVAIDEVRR